MVRLITLIASAGISLTTAIESESDAAMTWGGALEEGTPFFNRARAPQSDMFEAALPQLDITELRNDLRVVMKKNIAAWPADFGSLSQTSSSFTYSGEGGHYGPQLVRLAWHCSGTYRRSDGKGGCGGGRQRFEPERSWDDNTNLDKTRALLAPIKFKYGDSLSWGDLINFAATEAIRDMGGPVTKFCFGRIDEADGTESEALLENGAPCNSFQGNCQEPFGTGTTGLIYVNPEGPVIEEGGEPQPDPKLSAADIRDVFRRMGDTDEDIVALIGGGHAFGKCHGACPAPDSAGLRPSEAFAQNLVNAWQGTCGFGELKGVGPFTVTSGFEGPWTHTPTQWGNGFFTGLRDYEWEKHTGPGGHTQWRVVNATDYATHRLMRLTSDLALKEDPDFNYYVEKFAADQSELDKAFDAAWFKLTHRGGRWSINSRCDFGPMPDWVMDQNNKFMLDSDAMSV